MPNFLMVWAGVPSSQCLPEQIGYSVLKINAVAKIRARLFRSHDAAVGVVNSYPRALGEGESVQVRAEQSARKYVTRAVKISVYRVRKRVAYFICQAVIGSRADLFFVECNARQNHL